jgi:hypothetical protein
MGIDRIGKDGPSLPVPEVGGSARAPSSGAAFEVSPATATPPAAPSLDPSRPASHVEPAQGVNGALERLQAGELDLHGYVDAKVQEATAHLSALPPVELENIRSALRERLASDPTLIDLLHTATGEMLPPDDD